MAQTRDRLGKIRIRPPLATNFPISLGFNQIPNNEKIKEQFRRWGWGGHQGIDLACPEGTEVLAVDKGTVILAKVNGDYGNCIIIQHRWGSSLYAHLKEVGTALGESVARGKIIGLSGQSGMTFGAHLHFAMKFGSSFVDPLPFFLPDKAIVNKPVVRDSKTKNTQK